MRQLLSMMYTHINITAYISGDGWWLNKEGKNWWNRITSFPCDILYFSKVGEFDLKIAEEWYHIVPGMMVYVPMETEIEYSFNGKGPLEKYYTHFDLMFGENRLTDFFKLPYVTTVSDLERAERLFLELKNFYEQNTFEAGLGANGTLLKLIQCYIQECGGRFFWSTNRMDAAMQEVVRYIQENPGMNITVRELAERTGYSTGHFSKKFKKIFGCTPQAYMSNLKLEHAKNRLIHTEQPISAIAEELGFCDMSHFGNFFKAKTGMFPSYYRKKG